MPLALATLADWPSLGREEVRDEGQHPVDNRQQTTDNSNR